MLKTHDSLRKSAIKRLIGAIILVIAAIIIIPMIFGLQSRPVAINAAVEIPNKNDIAPIIENADNVSIPNHISLDESEEIITDSNLQIQEPPASTPVIPPAPPVTQPEKTKVQALKEIPAEPSIKKAEPKKEIRKEVRKETKQAEKKVAEKKVTEKKTEKKIEKPAEKKVETKPTEKKVAEKKTAEKKVVETKKPVKPEEKKGSIERAKAILAGKTRFVLQIGAYSDPTILTQAKERATKAGVKTYTQNVKTEKGNVVRLRVGPFNNQKEAENTAAKLKKSGVNSSIIPIN